MDVKVGVQFVDLTTNLKEPFKYKRHAWTPRKEMSLSTSSGDLQKIFSESDILLTISAGQTGQTLNNS